MIYNRYMNNIANITLLTNIYIKNGINKIYIYLNLHHKSKL